MILRISQVKVKNNLIVLRTGKPPRVWRKVIKQKYPGVVRMNNKNFGIRGLWELLYCCYLSMFQDLKPVVVNSVLPGDQKVTLST